MKYFITTIIFLIVSFLSTVGNAQTTVLQKCHGQNYPVFDGTKEICSYSVQFVGTCDGGDMYNKWSTVNASPPQAAPYIHPWEDHWIAIVGHEITDFTPGDGHSGWHIGSGYVADIQGGLGAGQNHVITFYPNGLVWMYPPVGYQTGGNPLKDLHGACTAGQTANIQVTFYYTDASALNPPTPPPPLCAIFDTLNQSDKNGAITLSNGNLTAINDGSNVHELVRAVSGIAPNTIKAHWEWTWSNQGTLGTPINTIGLQDGTTSVITQVGNGGIGAGRGYNSANGFFYTSGFTAASSADPMVNGTWAADYDSFSGTLVIRGPNDSVSTTMTASPVTLFPAVSMYGQNAGSVTFNFGATPFNYSVPSGYQAGLCQ